MVLWQHVMLCKSTLLGMHLAMVCVVCYIVRDYGVRHVLRSERVSHYVTHDAHHSQTHSQQRTLT